MIEAKIRLSANEMDLVTNAEWILTKNGIMQKGKWLLEDLQEQMAAYLRSHPAILQKDILYGTPKITRGENYNGLPYLVLDYPRIFQKEDIFAIRTMYWWGNFFSSTLHLGGMYRNLAEMKIFYGWDLLKNDGFYLCTNDGAWEHHFESTNYIPVAALSNLEFQKNIAGKSFIKIAKKVELWHWEDAAKILFGSFTLLTGILTANFPGGEKAL
jgi:hypothetical protein